MELTEKQKRFIDYYLLTGNATESCKLAGYKGNNLNRIGCENLSKLDYYISERLKDLDLKRIATLEEIFIYWTNTMNNKELKISDRLKASELLAKSQGAFVDKVEIKAIETDWFI